MPGDRAVPGPAAAVAHDGTVRTTTGNGHWWRAGLLAGLLTTGLVLVLVLDLPGVGEARAWVAAAGGAGLVGLALALALVLLAPVPRTAVSVLVGVVAGFGPGLAVAFAGGLLGALGAFGLSRTLGRAATERLAGPRLSRVDRLMVERGFLAVLAGRLLPVVPFVVLSYGAGLTALRLAPYLGATALGLIPSTVVQVGVGASVAQVAGGATALTVVPAVLVAGALLVVGVLTWRRGRNSALPEQPAQQTPGPADGARGQLQDRSPGDAGDRLDDRGQPQQPADVVHP